MRRRPGWFTHNISDLSYILSLFQMLWFTHAHCSARSCILIICTYNYFLFRWDFCPRFRGPSSRRHISTIQLGCTTLSWGGLQHFLPTATRFSWPWASFPAQLTFLQQTCWQAIQIFTTFDINWTKKHTALFFLQRSTTFSQYFTTKQERNFTTLYNTTHNFTTLHKTCYWMVQNCSQLYHTL